MVAVLVAIVALLLSGALAIRVWLERLSVRRAVLVNGQSFAVHSANELRREVELLNDFLSRAIAVDPAPDDTIESHVGKHHEVDVLTYRPSLRYLGGESLEALRYGAAQRAHIQALLRRIDTEMRRYHSDAACRYVTFSSLLGLAGAEPPRTRVFSVKKIMDELNEFADPPSDFGGTEYHAFAYWCGVSLSSSVIAASWVAAGESTDRTERDREFWELVETVD